MASIKKISSRKYKITVSNGYRPDGRKISRAKTIDVPPSVGNRGVEQYISHEAEEFERRVKSGYAEDGEMTFRQYAERWLGRQTKYAASTLASYRRMLERTYPYIGQIKLNRLRPVALENMITELRGRKHHGQRIREATVQKYLTVVSAVLSDAKRNEIIPKNPARMIDLPETEKREQEIPTNAQIQQLLGAICGESPLYAVYYALAINTGCRRGELCALRWRDFRVIHDSHGHPVSIVTVSRSRSIVPGKGVVEGPTKNGKSRVIVLSDPIVLLLMDLYTQWLRRAKRHPKISDCVFADRDGTPIHPDTFTKHLRRVYDRLGLPKSFHLHTLRHYFVSAMLHSAVDKQTVAELAGHGDTSFLERTYCHPQMALKQQAADRMAEMLFCAQDIGA